MCSLLKHTCYNLLQATQNDKKKLNDPKSDENVHIENKSLNLSSNDKNSLK